MKAIRVARNADQVELEACLRGYASVSDSLADEEISGEAEDAIEKESLFLAQEEAVEVWAAADSYRESEEGPVSEELERRSSLLGDLYPFEINKSSLVYRNDGGAQKIYESLLMISLMTNRQGRNWNALISAFERISATATKIYFDCDLIWWTGADSDSSLKDIFDEIESLTRQLTWSPEPALTRKLQHLKDGGLDFIVFKNIIDTRSSGVFYFGQAACGNNWYEKTKTDLRTNHLEKIFRKPFSDPTKLFAIPYLVTNDEELIIDASINIRGLILDRCYLTHILADASVYAEIEQDVEEIYRVAEAEVR